MVPGSNAGAGADEGVVRKHVMSLPVFVGFVLHEITLKSNQIIVKQKQSTVRGETMQKGNM